MRSGYPGLRVSQVFSIVVILSYFLPWASVFFGGKILGYKVLGQAFTGLEADRGSIMMFLLFASPILCHFFNLFVAIGRKNQKASLLVVTIPFIVWVFVYILGAVKMESLTAPSRMLPHEVGAVIMIIAVIAAFVNGLVSLGARMTEVIAADEAAS